LLESAAEPGLEEHWWVQSRQATNPFQESDSISNYFRRGMQDRVFHHNCALYGGNSGGPILIEGTDIAVGMPYSFEPNSVMRPFNDVFATGAHISDFVRRFGAFPGFLQSLVVKRFALLNGLVDLFGDAFVFHRGFHETYGRCRESSDPWGARPMVTNRAADPSFPQKGKTPVC
jgi:hypothetical protein